MEKIPAPYAIRIMTPWAEYADGTWRLAHQAQGDFRAASVWVRSGRAWAKRHHRESRFYIEAAGSRVKFVITPQTPEPTVLRTPSPEALAAWREASQAFFGEDPE